MTIDETLIYRLEHLTRLELRPEEREALKIDLNKILQMVETLEGLDLTGIEPLVYVSGSGAALREDEVWGQVAVSQALENAPDQDGTYFLAPKVIDLKK
ncbi:MAG: Asp-tRNA(Asn)/Glu-tRNA(Gln) amidotransferase subunit GatC [Haliscomenobacter sp.]|nr:Asp-tRNA(Asn)/Glu-tRNA(Gln) amidotransferase subunit GatC [Haliscomenobacter sp.]MBK7474509.1 Asp-tRNA(Asn)/Glu-tRNA(Gln) amidotransferase subunit GatC [Haliscomenobacter sp.]